MIDSCLESSHKGRGGRTNSATSLVHGRQARRFIYGCKTCHAPELKASSLSGSERFHRGVETQLLALVVVSLNLRESTRIYGSTQRR